MFSSLFAVTLLAAIASAVPAKRCVHPIWPLSMPQRNVFKSHFDGMVVFGDSFSDNGHGPGSSWVFTNHTEPTDPAYFNKTARRWSNGPVWVEKLSEGLNIPLTDYATGGATSGSLVPGRLTNLAGQTFTVPSAVDQVSNYVSSLEPGEDISKTLHVIFTGANDGYNLVYAGSPFNSTNYTAVADYVTEQVSNIVSTLLAKGATQFALPTYPDLTSVPLVSEEAAVSPNSNAIPELTLFGTTLRNNTFALAASIPSAAKTAGVNATVSVSVPDLFTLDEFLIKYGQYVGFKQLTLPCVGPGRFPNRTLCSTEPSVQNTYLHWDDVHPTARAHEYIALYALADLLKTYGVSWNSYSPCFF